MTSTCIDYYSLKRVIKKAIAAGKKPRIGTDCNVSIMGKIILDATRFLAAVTPTTNAARKEIAKAANIL
jgi:hypothetical protein